MYMSNQIVSLDIAQMDPQSQRSDGEAIEFQPVGERDSRSPSRRPRSRRPDSHSSESRNPNPPNDVTLKAFVVLIKFFMGLIAIAGTLFGILSVLASWRALDLATKANLKADRANDWAYLSYNASLVQIRLSLMQFCMEWGNIVCIPEPRQTPT